MTDNEDKKLTRILELFSMVAMSMVMLLLMFTNSRDDLIHLFEVFASIRSEDRERMQTSEEKNNDCNRKEGN